MYQLGAMRNPEEEGQRKGWMTNHKTAREWYMKAANKGHAEAMYAIGKQYQHGQVTPLPLFSSPRLPLFSSLLFLAALAA